MKPPMRVCVECGDVGFRHKDLCQQCRSGSPKALTRGAWVIDHARRVLVWKQAP